MSEEEKYKLEMTREEIDALIDYLEHFPLIVIDKKTNLIVGKITPRLTKIRELGPQTD